MADEELRATIYATGYYSDLQNNMNMIEDLSSRIESCNIIYYESENDVAKEELNTILEGVSMVLVFVTSKLLYYPNAARDVIIPYALSHCIPIVPVFLEKYIAFDYNEKYADILFIDSTDDEVAMSFAQRLAMLIRMLLMIGMQETFINEAYNKEVLSKLVGMQRANIHIRREYEMALIWQSHFMTMKREEYEEEKTEVSLKEWVGSCCDLGDLLRFLGYNDKAISIYSECRKHVDNNLPHIIYPLLCKSAYAYFSLKQYEKAVELFKEAGRYAEKLLESTDISVIWDIYLIWKSLGDLYDKLGDHSMSLRCYSSSLDFLNSYLKVADGPFYKRRLSGLYYRMGVCCSDSGDQNSAIDYYRKGIAVQKELLSDETILFDQADILIGYYRIGHAYTADGDYESAEKNYMIALEYAQKLAEVSESYQTRFNLTQIYSYLGEMYTCFNRTEPAKEHLYKSMMLTVKFFSKKEVFEVQYQLAKTYIQLGQLEFEDEEYENALGYQKNACDILEKLVKRRDQTDVNNNLGSVYERIAEIYEKQGLDGKAGEYYQKSLNTYVEVANRTQSLYALKGASRMYDALGDAYFNIEDYDNAESCYLDGYRLKQHLYKLTNDNWFIIRMTILCYNLGTVYWKKGDNMQVDKYYKEYIKRTIDLYDGSLPKQTGLYIIIACQRCAENNMDQGKMEAAEEYLVKAIEIKNKIFNELTSENELLRCSSLLNTMHTLCAEMHRYAEAIEYAKECLAIREMANEIMGTAESRNLVALTLEETALFILEHGNDPEECISFTMRAIKYRESIANETQYVTDYDKLANTYYNLGITVKGRKTQGLMLKEALSIWEDITEQTGRSNYQEDIKRTKNAIKYYHLEDICYQESD